MDSLWAGLPIVTLIGKSYVSRNGASLLSSLGFTELITHTPQEYEDIIISLAKTPNKLGMVLKFDSQFSISCFRMEL